MSVECVTVALYKWCVTHYFLAKSFSAAPPPSQFPCYKLYAGQVVKTITTLLSLSLLNHETLYVGEVCNTNVTTFSVAPDMWHKTCWLSHLQLYGSLSQLLRCKLAFDFFFYMKEILACSLSRSGHLTLYMLYQFETIKVLFFQWLLMTYDTLNVW